AFRSCAKSPAMWFSKPCCFRLENGRLSGSAQTLSSRTCAKLSEAANRTMRMTDLRQAEYIKHSSCCCVLWKIRDRTGKTQGCGLVASVQSAGNYCACPSSDTGENCHILLTVGPAISNWLADNS